MQVDVLIAGAGPAGSLAAIMLGKLCDVLLAEEHQAAGFPVQCAGLISEKCYESYAKYCKIKKAVENKIKGAFFFSPNGKCVEAKGDAYVIERKVFDSMLIARASEVARIAVKSPVRFKSNRILVGNRDVKALTIIGADGVYSVVAKHFKFNRPGIFTAIQIEARFEPIDERYVELYFGKAYTDSFFAYCVPIADTAKIGVICRSNAFAYLKNLIEKHPSVSKRIKGSVVELNVGAIPDRLVSFAKGSVALIGDAAGMVKPYTGGGLYYTLIAAEKLASNFPDLKAYERAYIEELGREHKFGEKIRKLYATLSDEDFNRLVELFKNFDFKGVHMDHPSTLPSFRIAAKMLRSPSLLFRVLAVLLS